MPRSSVQRVFTLDSLSTPIGELIVVTEEHGRLVAVDWEDHLPRMHRLLLCQRRVSADALDRGTMPDDVRGPLTRYFDGDVTALDALEVDETGTPFQRACWSALRRIPAGTTWSYGTLAATIGRPRAGRAVGLANGANPIGVVVPCHRVIGADRSLTGYGGGLARKRWLLAHEGADFVDAVNPLRSASCAGDRA